MSAVHDDRRVQIEYRDSTAEADWTAVKAAISTDDFDNVGTPEQYRLPA